MAEGGQPRRPGTGTIGRHWLPLNALRAFEAVARQLSFTGAAQSLHVSQSALSRHVSKLEEMLGARLLERRPSGLTLTEAGATLLPVVTKSFDRLEDVAGTIRRQGGKLPRRLKVHMPPTFLHQMGLPVLRDFRAAFPDILIDVSSAMAPGLPAGDLDVAVIYDRPRSGDIVRDLLWMVQDLPACSPELARRCEGMDLATFLAVNELLHVKLEGERPGALWADFARTHGLSLPVEQGLAFETAVLAVQFARSGSGVVLADRLMFAREIRDGTLSTPFATNHESGYGYYLTLHPEDMEDPVIALFRRWMIERFAIARGQVPPVEPAR